MPKEFITERDVEDAFRRGVRSLETGDHIVLTQLAYEKAEKLGIRVVSGKPENPPAAPVRPYLAQSRMSAETEACRCSSGCRGESLPVANAEPELHRRVREAAIARLGNQVDHHLLDVIVHRVLKSAGAK